MTQRPKKNNAQASGNQPQCIRIAYYVSPHGFGHAARACAVSTSLHQIAPDAVIDFFTLVPEWFFADSLSFPFGYFPLRSDIGVAQVDALREDLNETVNLLSAYLPFAGQAFEQLTAHLAGDGYRLVICDISPLGLAAAHRAGISSVLVENFTWDWIYAGYYQTEPCLEQFAGPLKAAFDLADYHFQTIPYCERVEKGIPIAPVARKARHSRAQIRAELELLMDEPLVLVTMGGVRQVFSALDALKKSRAVTYVIPGASETMIREDNLILLPHHSQFYHPDLVYASDLVVGKLGYSTVAEAYHAGIPYAYIPRPLFRETGPMGAFVESEMNGVCIPSDEFSQGNWVKRIPDLLNKKPLHLDSENGADQIAEYLLRLLQA
jgi:hypothetical protein